MPRILAPDDLTAQLADLPDWRLEGDELVRSVELADFAAALDFVVSVGHEAETMNHHPDVDIRWGTVRLALSTHSEGGITQYDVELAHRIDDLLSD